MTADPRTLERERRLADGRTVRIRPIRPDDEPRERRFLDALSGDTRRRRFMRYAFPQSEGLVHFFTHVDYERHMALVCETTVEGEPHLVGDARYMAHPDGRSCEFGIVVADDWHHTGIAQLLMGELMRAARQRGFETMEGLVLRDNADMLGFVSALGFAVQDMPEEPGLLRVVKRL
jgi:acetyltransferase